MRIGSTLFYLAVNTRDAFDGSLRGVSIPRSVNASLLPASSSVKLKNGFLEIARHKDLDNLQTFTIDASITLERVGGDRQNIVEGESPAVALYIDVNGKLVGAVNTTVGLSTVDSGNILLQIGRDTRICFTRNDVGKMELRMDGTVVGSTLAPQPIQNTGNRGIKIGSSVDGQRWFFEGRIRDLKIRYGVLPDQFYLQKQTTASRIEQVFKQKTGLPRVVVNLMPDNSDARLQPIKDIMNAAGVTRLNDLDILTITTRTVIACGNVIVAPSKTAGTIDWPTVASKFKLADGNNKRDLLAKYLTNRNSAASLKRFAQPTVPREIPTRSPLAAGGRIVGLGGSGRTSPRLSVEARRESPTLRLRSERETVLNAFEVVNNVYRVADPNLLTKLEERNPAFWPMTSPTTTQVYSLPTIAVDTAVIIAGTLDLTETQIVVEPDVKTFYIIAEKIICGNNASITWRRPDGQTPPRAVNLDLKGRGWSGINTKPNSRDGCDGENGQDGGAGLDGAAGRDAPNLEIWVKDMTAMPNIDLNGEDGIKGGKGQSGGDGGNGADGQVGRRYWFFGWHCSTDPGDGGDGGDGGTGGPGGSGGNGGNGGKITIGVLENTLESTVTSRQFRIKNQGGHEGRGGDGGDGGAGGNGGRSGVGETCKDAEDGHPGAQGQSGPAGLDGYHQGIDGEMEFLEFTQEAWDELLTRPWVSNVTPSDAFPGDTITLRGSYFSSGDRVMIDTLALVPTINADETISIIVPINMTGGEKTVYVRRQDGTESNRLQLWIKPQLDELTSQIIPATKITLNGHAFVNGASALIDGAAIPAVVTSSNALTFDMTGTGGCGSTGRTVIVQVRNPDGHVSNSRTGYIPSILEIPFLFDRDNLTFGNFTDGVPDWSTFEDTFGAAEVWHELLDPVFGHPILTAAFYGFYCHFLKGTANGGLATGFCTSLSSLVADNFWQGKTDTTSILKANVHKMLTAVHGKLLSRESLIHFHDQSQEEIARVERTYREIEATFMRGCDRQNAPLLFFIPSGAIWDSGYIDKLGETHCVMPYRFVYPQGSAGPSLSPDGANTTTDPDRVELYVWDCNKPTSPNCKLVFYLNGDRIDFEYKPDSTTPKFRSQDGITLGMMTNGQYMLADHDLPFSGPFGLTEFIVDFLLSPAELQITDSNGLRTGVFGGQILSEIHDSHPCYLVKGAYLLPTNTALSRKIIGSASGNYTFTSIMPNGMSLVLEGVNTEAGQEDALLVSPDATQIRFTPATEKPFTLTLARQVGDQARAITVSGMVGSPVAEVDITLSPELSLIRIGNRGKACIVDVRAFTIEKATNTPLNKQVSGVNLQPGSDLTIAVADWKTLDVSAEAVPFQ